MRDKCSHNRREAWEDFVLENFVVNKAGRRKYPASTLHVYFTCAGLFRTELKFPSSSTPSHLIYTLLQELYIFMTP